MGANCGEGQLEIASSTIWRNRDEHSASEEGFADDNVGILLRGDLSVFTISDSHFGLSYGRDLCQQEERNPLHVAILNVGGVLSCGLAIVDMTVDYQDKTSGGL